jgi:3-oxoadipate enol-lactonase
MAFTQANGIVLHHQVFGRSDGPALVFANSLGSDFRIWQEVAPAFLDRFRVILYDERGHGLSDAPPGPYSMDDHADDLLALLDALRVSRAAIVGLSVGGMIAQRIAAREPGRVSALVLCCTAVRIGTAESWAERIAIVEKHGIEAIAEAILARWFAPAFRETRASEYAGWRNMLVRTPVPGYVGTCATVRDADLTEDAGRIVAPTLCVAGEQDGSTPADLVQQTAALIPGAAFRIIERAGHIPCIERPRELAAIIQAHLKEAGLV